jgi:hypothetical protein
MSRHNPRPRKPACDNIDDLIDKTIKKIGVEKFDALVAVQTAAFTVVLHEIVYGPPPS